MKKKVFIIAGEPSGDYLGSRLIKDLKGLMSSKLDVYGIGGELMKSAGMKMFFNMAEITLIGVWEVIPKLLKMNKLINQTVDAILKYSPDVLVTIDSSGFTHRVARRLKKKTDAIPVVHYVAPPVWAWRPWRARGMHKFIDLLLTLFPFEPKYFEKYGLKSQFVGHPLAKDQTLAEPTLDEKQRFERKYHFASSSINICFLPGSRTSEIEHHMPIFNKAVRILRSKYDGVNVIIPTLQEKVELVNRYSENMEYSIITDRREKALAMYSSNIAIAASGSITLELAITKTPSVIIYKTSAVTAFIVRMLMKINMVSIVNILLKEKVIPELIQDECLPENIVNAIESLISSRDSIRQRDAYTNVLDMIREPEEMYAAKEILNLICERNVKCKI